jgi:hypothetical protein
MPITVSYPVERDVTDFAVFTGRIAAVDSVEVAAHASLELMHPGSGGRRS